jgi:hypothetical protein
MDCRRMLARLWRSLDIIRRRKHCFIPDSLRVRLAGLPLLKFSYVSLGAACGEHVTVRKDADDELVIGLYVVEPIIPLD